jgi:hypothetical protein
VAGFLVGPYGPAPATNTNPLLASKLVDSPNAQQLSLPNRTPAAAGTAGRWSIVDSPSPVLKVTDNVLHGVTCASATECWAVGYYYYGGDYDQSANQTLIERWDGNSWTTVDSPNTLVTQPNALLGVTCVSASDCSAVGYSIQSGIYQTLIERWNGIDWTIVSSPNTDPSQHNILYNVACVSSSNCWAVGYAEVASADGPFVFRTLVEQWDGSVWSIVVSPDVPGLDNVLVDVTCSSASDCWSVGFSFDGIANQTLIEHWNGVVWAITVSPNALRPAGAFPPSNDILYGVSCSSMSDCWAVGSFVGDTIDSIETLTEHWDGLLWSIVSSPNDPSGVPDGLYTVTCVSAANCWAVGFTRDPTEPLTLVEHWDGIAWAIVNSPNVDSDDWDELLSVACASDSECWGVGVGAPSRFQTVAERWDGSSWTITESPNKLIPLDDILSDVTCVSASDCWAVGSYYDDYNGNGDLGLIDHWDGTSWTMVSAPQTRYLSGVRCTSGSDCWTAGAIEHWDGSSWTVNGAPDPVFSLSCVSASDCWAAGYHFGNGTTAIDHWDGTAWATVTSPGGVPRPYYNYLNDVTCVSASDCWAVGWYGTASGTTQALIEHWDGSVWTVVSANTGAAPDYELYGVACASASNCWTVGGYAADNTTAPYQTLIEHWDGTSWAVVTSPNTSTTQHNMLKGVTCASELDCWAVGWHDLTPEQTLIEHWDGSSWSLVDSPNVNTVQWNNLYRVTCASVGDCWAVGFYGNGQTLIEHYTLPIVHLSGVVSRKSHGSAGTFDVDLTNGNGIECRSGGANRDYTLVFAFASPLASVGGASVTTGNGSVATSNIDSNDSHNYIVNLSGVANAQTITVTLTGVADSLGNFSASVPISMGVLLGDVNASRRVDAADVSLVRQQTLQPITASNFREDINVTGRIDAADVSIVRQQTLTSLP